MSLSVHATYPRKVIITAHNEAYRVNICTPCKALKIAFPQLNWHYDAKYLEGDLCLGVIGLCWVKDEFQWHKLSMESPSESM